MKLTKILCFLVAAVAAVTVFAKQPKNKTKYGVYVAGVSASFTDSLVYMTDIQYVDSASLDKNGFWVGRALYSLQLKDYLEMQKGERNRTCFVFFSSKKKSLQKELSKLKQKYEKGKTLVVLSVGPDFKFEKADTY